MNCGNRKIDFGPEPYVTNAAQDAKNNSCFRTAIWTGCHVQMTLMSIPVCSDIGVEMHENTDQIIRIEQGVGLVKTGACRNRLDWERNVCQGDVVFVPAGTWHNVINVGRVPLKLSSVYAPPKHPKGTVHYTKEEAEY